MWHAHRIIGPNEEKVKEYVHEVIVPYVKNKREELKLSSTQPAIVLFEGQLASVIVSLLEDNNIYLVKIQANFTDRHRSQYYERARPLSVCAFNKEYF
jgi:hypothetical protein